MRSIPSSWGSASREARRSGRRTRPPALAGGPVGFRSWTTRRSCTATCPAPRRTAGQAGRAGRLRRPPATDPDRDQPPGPRQHVASVEVGYFGGSFRPPARPAACPGWRTTPNRMPTCGRPRTKPGTRSSHCTTRRPPTATPPLKPCPWTPRGQVPWCRRNAGRHPSADPRPTCCVETAQHLGQADILRELIDGRPGRAPATEPDAAQAPRNGPRTGHASSGCAGGRPGFPSDAAAIDTGQ